MIGEYQSTIVANVLADAASKQTIYRRYANTINGTAAALAGALTALAAQWTTTGEFPKATAILVILAPFLTAVATRLTKNGISPSVEREAVAAARKLDSEDIAARTIAVNEEVAEEVGGEPLTVLPVYGAPSTAMEGQ